MFKPKKHALQLERKDDSGAGGTGGQVLELKSLVQKIGQAFDEFKKTNDDLLKAKADGKAVSDLEAKMAKLDKDIADFTEAKQAIEQIMVKLNRPGMGGGNSDQEEKLATEVKNFNAYRKSWATTHTADVTTEQYVAYKSAFFNLVRTGNPDRLSDDERKAMQVGSDSDGGYLVPTPTVGRIVQRVFETSPIRQIASVMTISTDALEGLNDNDEADAGWVGETGARNDTDTPQVGKYRIEAAEMYAQPKATQKLLDDAAVDVEGWLAAKVADKFTRVENLAFVAGDGVAKPRGFTAYPTAATADSTRAWGTLEHIVTGANGDFGATTPADKLLDLVGAFKDQYLQNGRWVTRREVMTKVRKFKDGQNQYLWQPGLQAGQPQQLLGFPVTIAQDMPTLATGSLSMAFGDFKEGYQIVDRIGIRVLRDPYTSKPYVKFYTTKRTGGGVLNFEAIKFLKFGT